MIEYLDLHTTKFSGEAECIRWYGTMERLTTPKREGEPNA
jgi:hypothetical protein